MKSVYHTLNPHFVVESTVLKEPPSGFPIESILTVGGYVIVPILSGVRIYSPYSTFAEDPLLEFNAHLETSSGEWLLVDGSKIIFGEPVTITSQ